MNTDPADGYLTIPADWGPAVRRLRWARGCDAIETDDGGTLTLVDQLAAVLEGVFAAPPVPPFGFVLALLTAFKHGGPGSLIRLRDAYAAAGPAGRGRTAGLLIAELCRGLPACGRPPTWPQVDLALKRRLLFGERHRPELAEVPPVPGAEFGRAVADRLTRMDDAALRHWLTHGAPPTPAGPKLAEAADSFPRRAALFLDLVRRRDRLVGAAALAPALDAAIALPPRRPRAAAVPQGGYADVTTRGDPDRLLPTQFALDPDEFVRRFADRELLYFRREEPHRPRAPQRVLVVDQGVRTWGPVRLGLAAGAVAVLGKDPARAGRLRVALTSHPDPFDPFELPPAELADRLERSDLSATPADALTLALDDPPDPADAPRDVILLTHPRALGEADIRSAAAVRRPEDRLFTLTLDDAGRADLGEWTPGGVVRVRAFRVDLVAAEAAKAAGPPPAAAGPTGGWDGDVEPVPFPFRAGLVADIEQVGFDAAGEWAVTVGRGGAVHVKHLADDRPVEVLPRAARNGELLRRADAVLGVAGGVAVCGRMPLRAEASVGGAVFQPADLFAVAHYDFASRTVKLHTLPAVDGTAHWYAFPDLHCVAVRPADPGRLSASGAALDLATGGRHPDGDRTAPGGLIARAVAAWDRAARQVPTPTPVPSFDRKPAVPPVSGPYLVAASNYFLLHRSPRNWSSLRPLLDGRPLARGATPLKAVLAGDTLAVVLKDAAGKVKLNVFRGPDGAVLGEHGPVAPAHAVALSAAGGRLARQVGGRAVEVRDTAPGGATRAVLPGGGYHTAVDLRLDPGWVRVQAGRHAHTFPLAQVPFRHDRSEFPHAGPAAGRPAGYGRSAAASDPDRFAPPVAAGPWLAAWDRWGQVVLMDRSGKLVMTVAVRRELAAAWLPDGTLWGAAALLGGPPHPDAADRVGRALRAAAEGS